MTTTTHQATCTCCGTGELTITVDDAGTWSPSDFGLLHDFKRVRTELARSAAAKGEG